MNKRELRRLRSVSDRCYEAMLDLIAIQDDLSNVQHLLDDVIAWADAEGVNDDDEE